MNYFYFDQNNQKLGPVSEQQLKELAAQGAITPQTSMETDTGHKGTAGQIPGMFPPAPPNPFSQPAQTPPTPPPADLFCTNCGNSVSAQAAACMSCGARPTGHKKFCRQCGAPLNPEQVVCVKCGTSLTATMPPKNNVESLKKPLNLQRKEKNEREEIERNWGCIMAISALCLLIWTRCR